MNGILLLMGTSKNCYFILPFGKLRVNSAQDERGIVIIRLKTTLMVSLLESSDRTIIRIFRGTLIFNYRSNRYAPEYRDTVPY